MLFGHYLKTILTQRRRGAKIKNETFSCLALVANGDQQYSVARIAANESENAPLAEGEQQFFAADLFVTFGDGIITRDRS